MMVPFDSSWKELSNGCHIAFFVNFWPFCWKSGCRQWLCLCRPLSDPIFDRFFWQRLLLCSLMVSRSIELALSFLKRHSNPSYEQYWPSNGYFFVIVSLLCCLKNGSVLRLLHSLNPPPLAPFLLLSKNYTNLSNFLIHLITPPSIREAQPSPTGAAPLLRRPGFSPKNGPSPDTFTAIYIAPILSRLSHLSSQKSAQW